MEKVEPEGKSSKVSMKTTQGCRDPSSPRGGGTANPQSRHSGSLPALMRPRRPGRAESNCSAFVQSEIPVKLGMRESTNKEKKFVQKLDRVGCGEMGVSLITCGSWRAKDYAWMNNFEASGEVFGQHPKSSGESQNHSGHPSQARWRQYCLCVNLLIGESFSAITLFLTHLPLGLYASPFPLPPPG